MALKTKHSNKSKYKKFLIPFLLGSLIVSVLVLAALVANLYNRNRIQNNSSLAELIIQAVDALNQDVPIDPRTGVVYINEAKLTLPAQPQEVGPLVYSYERANEDFKPILHIARKYDISRSKSALLVNNQSLEKTFNAVPHLQACSRGVTISFDTKNLSKTVESKVLSNGKTVYFSTEPLCKNEALLAYAKQIDSYN